MMVPGLQFEFYLYHAGLTPEPVFETELFADAEHFKVVGQDVGNQAADSLLASDFH
jgi:hypothetical protein